MGSQYKTMYPTTLHPLRRPSRKKSHGPFPDLLGQLSANALDPPDLHAAEASQPGHEWALTTTMALYVPHEQVASLKGLGVVDGQIHQ